MFVLRDMKCKTVQQEKGEHVLVILTGKIQRLNANLY